MRRASIYVMLLLLGANLYSCGKENFGEADTLGKGDTSYSDNNNTTPGEDGEIEEEKKEFIDTTDWSGYDENEYLIGFSGECEETEVRATITMGNSTTPAVTAWESGDQVKVYVPATNKVGIYAYDATRKQFRPINVNNVVSSGNGVAYAYYPASAYGTPSGSNGSVSFTLNNGLANLGALGDKLPMSGIVVAGQNNPHPVVSFKNLCSILRLQLTGCEKITSLTFSNDNISISGAGTVTWNGEKPSLAISGGAKSITLALSDVTLDEKTPKEYYFILPSGGNSMSGMKVSAKFSQTDGTTTYTPTPTRSRNGALDYGRSQVIKVALRMGFFSGGNGTSSNPYQIAKAADLKALNDFSKSNAQTDGYTTTNAVNRNYFRSNIYYKQTANIDCKGLALNVIGPQDYNFYASYDGDNKTLSNISITNQNQVQVALFGRVAGGTLQNIIIQNATISSTCTDMASNTAALVGRLQAGAKVLNCQVITSTISGMKTAGVVGYSYLGTISGCKSRGNTITSSGQYSMTGDEDLKNGFCGGILGGSHKVTIENCCCYGANADGKGTPTTLTCQGVAGGIAGYMGAADNATPGVASATDCYVSNTKITSTGANVGGHVGILYKDCTISGRTYISYPIYSIDTLKGPMTIQGSHTVGGVVGKNLGTIQGSKFATANDASPVNYLALSYGISVTATKNKCGGIAGTNSGNLIKCYAVWTTIRTQGGGSCSGVCGYNTGTLTDCMYRGSKVRAMSADGTTYYDAVGGLCGTLEGGTIDLSEATSHNGTSSVIEGKGGVGGLVGQMIGGTLKGKNSRSYVIDADSDKTLKITAHGAGCSMAVGHCLTTPGSIQDVTVGAKAVNAVKNILSTDENSIGGIVGLLETETTVSNCENRGFTVGKVNTYAYVGGIVGSLRANVSVSHCLNATFDFNVPDKHGVGGICGFMEWGQIYQCRNYANVTGAQNVGGIIGKMCGGNLLQSYSGTGKTITGTFNVGGLVGRAGYGSNDAEYKHLGTASTWGTNSYCLIMCCASRSNVTATSANGSNGAVGGLVGRAESNFSDCYVSIGDCVALGAVVQNTADAKNIGGVVGFAYGSTEAIGRVLIQNCYAQTATNQLLRAGGNQATVADNNAGGVFGYLKGATAKDCYYRCDQSGRLDTTENIAETDNCTKISHAAKNGTDTFTVTLSKVSGKTLSFTGYLYEVLSKQAERAPSFKTMFYDGDYSKKLDSWSTYDSGENHFALPTRLYTLGKEFYLD